MTLLEQFFSTPVVTGILEILQKGNAVKKHDKHVLVFVAFLFLKLQKLMA